MIKMKDMFSAKLWPDGRIREVCCEGRRLAVSEKITVYTDYGTAELFSEVERDGEDFVYAFPFAEFRLCYKSTDGDFSERLLSVSSRERLIIYKIEKTMVFSEGVEEVLDYKTFRYASAAAFVRFDGFGLYTGFANPYFASKKKDDYTLSQSFEPSLILEPGEEFEFDSDFLCLYNLEGKFLEERTPRTPLGDRKNGYMTRYHNPCADMPLDWAEIRHFQRFTEAWLAPSANRFLFEFYMYFSPVKPQPQTEEAEKDYYRYIDNFVQLGGDIIVFQPLQRQTPPSIEGKSYWEVYSPGSVGERILTYAAEKGLICGIYMGSAQDNVDYCNSTMTPYASKDERPGWKKKDRSGTVSDENCIACNDFADWYFEVQKNTIEKYRLGFWDWDPGLGNGNFCYSENHGHLPGKGAYKGFKNTQKIIQKVKKLNGGMYLQAFHGMKEYGLWGMKCFDQHEAYWEQDPGFFATMYPDFSADRITANGMRLQAWWNQNFRFLPATINHSLTHRMIQNCNRPDTYLREMFDYVGYKFAFMSALAAGASITSPIIPYTLDNAHMREYQSFYLKWINWARENFAYLKKSVAFGSQPDVAMVDGYARIVGDKGFLFLCNGNPVKSTITFSLDGRLGFYGQEKYGLNMLYPHGGYYFDDVHETGVFRYGDEITIIVEENSVYLFEIVKYSDDILMYGAEGSCTVCKDTAAIQMPAMPVGTERSLVILQQDGEIRTVLVNGTVFQPVQYKNHVRVDILYGERSDRYLSNWEEESSGVLYMGNRELKHVKLRTKAVLPSAVSRSLETYRDAERVEIYAGKYGEAANMQYAWSLPHRLYLVIPFVDAEEVEGLRAFVNGKECALQFSACWAITSMKKACFFGDVTELVTYDDTNEIFIQAEKIGENMFLGGYLSYPELECTKTVTQTESGERRRGFGLSEPAAKEPWGSNPPIIPSSGENGGIRILYARCTGAFREHSVVRLEAALNKAPQSIRRVLCSCPITIDDYSDMTMNTDRELLYNEERGIWETELIVGQRRLLIIDDAALHIRAVDCNGFVDQCTVEIEWEF